MRVLFFSLALCVSVKANTGYEFILGKWTSDFSLSIDRLEQFDDLTESQVTELIEKWPKISWEIDLGELTFRDAFGNSFTSPYFIRPIDDIRFEIIIPHTAGEPDIAIIEKTNFGFCATFTHQHLKLDFEIPRHVDCFRRRDA